MILPLDCDWKDLALKLRRHFGSDYALLRAAEINFGLSLSDGQLSHICGKRGTKRISYKTALLLLALATQNGIAWNTNHKFALVVLNEPKS